MTKRLMLVLIPIALVAAACGDDDVTTTTTAVQVDVLVESLEVSSPGELRVEFGVGLIFADGDPVTGAEVRLRADRFMVPESVAVETVPGVYIGGLDFPELGSARVIVSFDGPDAIGSVEFTQPVSGIGAAVPTVRVDTAQPGRVGSEVGDDSGILAIADTVRSEVSGDSPVPVVVEAFVAKATNPLAVEYAVSLAAVALTAMSQFHLFSHL